MIEVSLPDEFHWLLPLSIENSSIISNLGPILLSGLF